MVSIQEQFVIKSGLWWRAYGIWKQTENVKFCIFDAFLDNFVKAEDSFLITDQSCMNQPEIQNLNGFW